MKHEHHSGTSRPELLTSDDVAALLRTTRKAIYGMVERRQLPGVIRIGVRLRFRASAIDTWLEQQEASFT